MNGCPHCRRGVEVEVPPAVAEVLEHSQVGEMHRCPHCFFKIGVMSMTVGQALERAEELRPGCKVDSCTRQRWLCEEDGMLRALLFSGCGLRAGVGADLAWCRGRSGRCRRAAGTRAF